MFLFVDRREYIRWIKSFLQNSVLIHCSQGTCRFFFHSIPHQHPRPCSSAPNQSPYPLCLSSPPRPQKNREKLLNGFPRFRSCHQRDFLTWSKSTVPDIWCVTVCELCGSVVSGGNPRIASSLRGYYEICV